MAADLVLACDIGGTRVRVALVSPDGAVAGKEASLTPDDAPDALVNIMNSALAAAGGNVAGVVVGAPGMVDYTKGEALKLPNLSRWNGYLKASRLTGELGVKTLIANDADLGALGEHRFGAGRGFRDMVYVTASTGIGSGVILNGRLLHGRLSLGEIGHTIIDRDGLDTVEGLASGVAMRRATGMDAKAIADRARAGDEEARRRFDRAARDLAVGVYNLVLCFSPEAVVIGGGMSQSGDMLLNPVRDMLRGAGPFKAASQVKVVRAEGGDDVGLKGAAAFWSDYGA